MVMTTDRGLIEKEAVPTSPMGQRNALTGIRVVDLTQFAAGTSCTQFLAWLGAEVIKIEPPGRGEQGRRTTAGKPGIDSYYFMMLNCNKRSVTVNLKHEKGRAILRGLIEQGDVMIENFGPGVIERLGFDYEHVKKINPKIIYAQIKGFSPDGPYGSLLAFDPVIQAAGGIMGLTGDSDGPPVRPGATIGDTGAGLHCTIGILAALYQRRITGEGQRVEIAMQETVLNYLRVAYAAQMETGKAVERSGSFLPVPTAPGGFYRCKGGGMNDYVYIYTSRQGNQHWERLLVTIGRKDLIGDPRFSTAEVRGKHHEEIDAMVVEWTSRHGKREVMKLMGEAGTPVGAVFDTMELSTDAHLRERGMFVTLNHPVRGEVVVPGWPVRLSESSVKIEPAPLLGADNEKVLTQLLNIDANELAVLRRENVV